MYQPRLFLVVMDGWGYSENRRGNAILQAQKPVFDKLWQFYPHTLIEASGETAGLTWGAIGGSEVGHFCMGSGRIIYHDLLKIAKSINSGDFFRSPVILGALNHAKKYHSNLHLVGLTSAGGVHSHIDHLYALLELLHRRHFHGQSFIHMFTDGRDVPIKSAELYCQKVTQRINSLHLKTQFASVIGRYYAMDRDSHWERTFQAYNCLVLGRGNKAHSAQEAILEAYQQDQTDEFISPTVIIESPEKRQFLSKILTQEPNQVPGPVGLIKDNDAVIFFNFRSERMKQLMETFLFPQTNFPDKKMLKNVYMATMVEYDASLPVYAIIPTEKIQNPLAKILSDNNLRQLHIAETEKYAHVTYFFDGSNPVPYLNEEWVAIPSPRIATYDLQPEMSASKITDKIFALAEKKQYDFILVNFANADMVGHTANFQATIKAVETIDQQLGRLTEQFPDSVFLITADHGNAEELINLQTGERNSEHSVRPVPFILAGPKYKKEIPDNGPASPTAILADVAPTVLDALNIPIPEEMTGCSLLKTIA